MFVSLIGFVSEGVPQVLVGKEGAGHLIDPVIGPDGFEVFHVVPEVGGGVGPVGDSWGLIIGHSFWDDHSGLTQITGEDAK